jgi:hypothetical protein
MIMGIRMPETYLAVCKRQTIKPVIICCIWLVDSFEYFILTLLCYVVTYKKRSHTCII